MPFDPNNPPAKLKNLSDKKQRQWVEVFNSCYSKTPDDKKCHMQAWGVVKKSASDESLKDIVDQNPDLVAKVEEMFGMRWNGDKFEALYYPDIAKSEVDRVDNAPGGITAALEENLNILREKRASMRIVKELNNALRDVRAAFEWKHGLERKTVRTTKASSR